MTAEELLTRYAQGERDFRGVVLRDADLRRADLSHVILQGADLTGSNLAWANLYRADLSRASLRGARLSRIEGQYADFRWADLRRAFVHRADLRAASLAGANLAGALLMETILIQADLRDANLRRADLCGTNLAGAALCGADFRGAFVWQARLQHSDWTGAIAPDGRRSTPPCQNPWLRILKKTCYGAWLGACLGARYFAPWGGLLGAIGGIAAATAWGPNVLVLIGAAAGWCLPVLLTGEIGFFKGLFAGMREPRRDRHMSSKYDEWWGEAA